jgi:HAD superfamily hydrolase (TIGR01490 family)
MTRAAAFFDIDGTLVGKNIVHHYMYIRRRMLPPILRPLWTAAFLARAPYYLVLDKFSRTRLNVVFYRNYAGLPTDKVKALVGDNFEHVIRPHIYREVPACLEEHRAAGRRIVLVTGSVDVIMHPLAKHLGVDAMFAPKLVESSGRYTGALDGPPVGSHEKARRIIAYVEQEHIDLTASYAYGDSIADVPMLALVGHPHAVNPDKALARTAADRGWKTLRWTVPGPKQAAGE